MNRIKIWFVSSLVTVASIYLIWLTEIPLGIPGEWTWIRISTGEGFSPDWALVALGAVLYVGFAWLGRAYFPNCSHVGTVGWLGGLLILGFSWLWVVQDSPPPGYRLSKVAWVLYYPGSSGYFYEARYQMDSVDNFLSRYEEKMAEEDVLHVGTHPPGLFLFHRGLLHICRESPNFSQFLLQTCPASVSEAFSILAENTRRSSKSLLKEDRASLWLAALITQFMAVATIFPFYGLLRRNQDRQTCWMIVTLWPLIPALALFLPKSDALYPVLGMTILFLWLEGWNHQSAWRCCAAGFLFWIGLFLSLAFLPVALLGGLFTLWQGWLCETEQRPASPLRQTAKALAWANAGFLLPTIGLWLAVDLNLFQVWWWNYQNHAGFYDEFSRTYWKWLLVNPLELMLALGAPLAVLVGSSFRQVLSSTLRWRSETGHYWTCTFIWTLLWLSGKNMGEAARIWLFLMPWFLWMAAPPSSITSDRTNPPFTSLSPKSWLVLLVLQLIASTALVLKVSGFHLGSL